MLNLINYRSHARIIYVYTGLQSIVSIVCRTLAKHVQSHRCVHQVHSITLLRQ